MIQQRKRLRALSGTTGRRIRNTPNYLFLLWRWSAWFYAAIIIIGFRPKIYTSTMVLVGFILLGITFVQTLLGTLYAPVFQVFFPHLPRLGGLRPNDQTLRRRAQDDDVEILTPLASTPNRYFTIAIYALDVIVCGLVVYFSGPNGGEPYFGVSSPFHRYSLSAALASGFAYGYPGAIAASVGIDLFNAFAIFVHAPGTPAYYSPNVLDITGSLFDTPLVAIIAAAFASILVSYAQSKRREQDNTRRQRALVRVSETLAKGATNMQQLLEQTVSPMRQGGHFQRLMIALVNVTSSDEANKDTPADPIVCVEIDTHIDTLPDDTEALMQQVMQSGQKLNTFEPLHDASGYGIARLYLPLYKDGQIQLVLGAENVRQTPYGERQEEFLAITGAQLLVALDNIRLTEETIELNAAAERSRIAREIHDGIAQLVYMMSLNAETCATQAHRMAEASEEDAELITPLAKRMDTLVTVSKQALWETRNYMFNLKPLMSGSTNLTQMLTNQVREFQAISSLPTHFEVIGVEAAYNGDQKRIRRYAQVGAAIFRIVQEALTNAYKHADATQLWVQLYLSPEQVAVEISDDGQGMQSAYYSYDLTNNGERQRIYSGHGMRGMRERAEELGGTFDVAPLAEGGVRVHVQIPV
ncbi:MAG: hypothetical protein PVS3B3_36950 [Ktedonobacteraceae bacterium]